MTGATRERIRGVRNILVRDGLVYRECLSCFRDIPEERLDGPMGFRVRYCSERCRRNGSRRQRG